MPQSKDIQTEIGYYSFETGQKPFVFTRQRHEHEKENFPADSTEELDPCVEPVTIYDGRHRDLTLDKHSFQRFDAPTSMSRQDFFDPDKLKNVYFKEVKDLMKKATGAKEVIIFNHFVRCKELVNGTLQDHHDTTLTFSSVIHTDSHPWSAERTRRHFVKETGRPELANCRVLYLTSWRNINDTPVLNNHLVMADEASITKPDDVVVRDQYSFDDQLGDYYILQYGLNNGNAKRHKWYYYPGLTRQEVILHKQYDSDFDRPARLCFHTSAPDPTAPANNPCRASVEVRGLCFFPQESNGHA